MEYCELGDLQAYLSSSPPLPETQAQEITFQILEGVRYMHENEVAHRDLKPGVRSQIPSSKVLACLTRTCAYRTSLSKPVPRSPGGLRLQILASQSELKQA